MKIPPDYLKPLMMDLEKVVLNTYKEFPRITGSDIEWAYDKLADYFKSVHKGKATDEPESFSEVRQALVDELLNIIDAREEDKLDDDLILNPNILHGTNMIPSLPFLYSLIFKNLKSSARFWRKENGQKGYVNYISNFIP
ncbi:MAG: hypothetical protein AAF573_07865 [Bacteroidota bacterium]